MAIPPARVGGQILPAELRHWLSVNKEGKASGSAALIPFTRDPKGNIFVLLVHEFRSNIPEPVFNWLAGKREILQHEIPELPVQTALREAAEESNGFTSQIIEPVNTILNPYVSCWSPKSKMFLFLVKVPWHETTCPPGSNVHWIDLQEIFNVPHSPIIAVHQQEGIIENLKNYFAKEQDRKRRNRKNNRNKKKKAAKLE